jgi:WD40 repeat protein
MSAQAPVQPPSAETTSPFLGLRPFSKEDTDWFFGRERETKTIVANMRAARLTVLHAPSGVGKSSVLNAGVVHRLTALAARQATEGNSPRYIPVVFGSWADEPTTGLIGAISAAVAEYAEGGSQPPLPERLDLALDTASAACGGARLLVILDQFEEYLMYSAANPDLLQFADELAACVNRVDARANFLIAIRDDVYSGLGDMFAGKITNVYANHLQLQYLDPAAGREAILGPIARFNELHPDQPEVIPEPALVEAVLRQVRIGEIGDEDAEDNGEPDSTNNGQPDSANNGEPGSTSNSDGAGREEIEAPYLQLVMRTLWQHRQSGKLRLATLEELGDAKEIVRAHTEGALKRLPAPERDAAVEIFRLLVTPSGTKIAHAASDLADMTELPPDEVTHLLAKLSQGDQRILRHVPPPPGRRYPDDRYEVYHDVLARSIVKWRRGELEKRRRAAAEADRKRLEQEAAEATRRADEEEHRRRMFQWLAIGAGALLVIAIVLAAWAFKAQKDANSSKQAAHSGQLAASAEAVLPRDPELSALLALRGLRGNDTAAARTALLRAMSQLRVLKRFPVKQLTYDAAFSADGTKLITGEGGGTATLWSVATRKPLLKVAADKFGVYAVAISQDGSRIATVGDKGGAIWSATSGQRERSLPGQEIEAVAFSPDGRQLATADQHEVTLSNVSTGERLHGLPNVGGSRSVSLAYDRTGDRLAVGYQSSVGVFRTSDGKLLKLIHLPREALNGVGLNPSGTQVVTADELGTARVWDAASGRQLLVLSGANGNLYTAYYSPDGGRIVTAGEDGTARIWDASTGRQLAALAGHVGTVRSAEFNRNGTEVVTAGEDGTARIWSALPPDEEADLTNAYVNSVAYAPDGRHFLTGSADGIVTIWDTASRRPVKRISAGPELVTAISFSADGRTLLTADGDSTIRLWNARDWQPRRQLRSSEADEGVSAALDPSGRTAVAVGLTGVPVVWDTATGHSRLLEPTETSLWGVAIDGHGHFVTTGERGSVTLWDARTGKKLGPLLGYRNIVLNAAFSPDGSRIAAAGADGTVRVWNAYTRKPLWARPGPIGVVSSVAFNQAGTEIVATGSDGTISIWSASGEPLTVFRGGADRTTDAKFSPDGQQLLVGGEHSASLWSTRIASSRGAIEAIARSRLTRSLTPEERQLYGE